MIQAKINVPMPTNEPVKNYAPGSSEREDVKQAIASLRGKQIEIPLVIGGKEIKTGNTGTSVIPHDHQTVLARYHKAGEEEVAMAVDAALAAQKKWAALDWHERIGIFLKAAELISGPYRNVMNAASMLSQGKNVYQAEIDAACELIDFLRFNAYYAMQIFEQQPLYSSKGIWNRMDYRPLEGFIFAVTPFNFAAIAGNLPSAPAMVGNVVLWKPASNAVYSAHHIMKIFMEAGVPDGVINFIPGPGNRIGPTVLESPHLAGVHFTGSTAAFQSIWQTVGQNIAHYKSYPRIVGETGGKDFIFVHPSADFQEVGTAIIRGAFEYQGQKCSAVSRVYIPESLWADIKTFVLDEMETITMGDAENFTNFMNAVIDEPAFDKIKSYIDYLKGSNENEIIYGGGADKSKGYFIEPTIAVTTDPQSKTMIDEIFGPVVTIYVYRDDRYEETLYLCNETSPYGLTGAIFSKDKYAAAAAERVLINAAGNFYLNDKPTGSIVGQQPFGGSRASGTNDKAGSFLNMVRWLNPRSVKENFLPPKDYRYPFLGE